MEWRMVLLLFFSLCYLGAPAQENIYFPPPQGTWEKQGPEELGWCTDSLQALYNYLESNDTRAFLVLKDGRIVLEEYFYSFQPDSVWYWASAGKTLTAFLTGLAQEQGFLSVDDPTSEYLGDWTMATREQQDSITIWHQLTMTTGLDDSVDDLNCTDKACLKYLAEPGTRWSYHNAPYALIGDLIEEATGLNYNRYTRNALLNPIGGTGAWLRLDYNRVFFSRPRTMARFGLLMLARGEWDSQVIMNDGQYFDQMITPSQDINPAYGYLWWLNGQKSIMVPGIQQAFNQALCPPAPDDMIAAMGKNSQLLNVVPSKGLVVVRMGESPSNAPVPYDLQDGIWEYLNQIMCTPSNQTEKSERAIQISPNPAVSGKVSLKGQMPGESGTWNLYDVSGRMVFQTQWNGSKMLVDLPAHIDSGVHVYLYQSNNGSVQSGRLMVQR